MDNANVFAINLENRTDRKASIISEFAGKDEFQLTIFPAIEHEVGAFGLWQTFYEIVRQAYEEGLEYVIICEDDHTFTPHYSATLFQRAMDDAVQFQADVLLGGVSWFTNCIPVRKNLNWVEKFSGLQFTVVFKKFYAKILNTSFQNHDVADYKISMLSDKIYFIYPFISIQKEFGYSDVTPKNNLNNRVLDLFKNSDILVKATKQVISFYKKKIKIKLEPEELTNLETISLTTYVLHSKSSQKLLSSIHSQFEGRTEFDIRMVKLYEHTNTEQAYRLTLHKIVQQAVDDGDEVIIVCDDDHQFTEAYSKEYLVRHILEGHRLGTRILCGAVDDFENAIPVCVDKLWVKAFESASFIVLYRSIFEKILIQPIFDDPTSKSFYREITSNKLVMFPFISMREGHNTANYEVTCPSPEDISSRLAKIYEIAELSDESLVSRKVSKSL